MSISPGHIPFSRLADYMEGRLPLDEHVGVDNHVASCSECAEKLDRVQQVLGFLQTGEDAPASVVQRVKSLFTQRNTSTLKLSELRRRVVAVLHFDSGGLTPVFGVRSSNPGTRQLLFSSESNEIDLRIVPEGQSWLISGQILGESAGAGMVVLEGEAGLHGTAINKLSEFALPPVQAGSYKLTLKLRHVDVEIDELKVGS
jgi:hypothetical protein